MWFLFGLAVLSLIVYLGYRVDGVKKSLTRKADPKFADAYQDL